MKKTAIALLATWLAQAAWAQSAPKQTVFSCSTQTGKQLALTHANRHYTYSFGLPDKPDLVFRNSARQVEQHDKTYQKNFEGQLSIALQNGNHTYVIDGKDMNNNVLKPAYGVQVLKNGRMLTDIPCHRRSKAHVDLQGVFIPPVFDIS